MQAFILTICIYLTSALKSTKYLTFLFEVHRISALNFPNFPYDCAKYLEYEIAGNDLKFYVWQGLRWLRQIKRVARTLFPSPPVFV